MGFSRKNGFEKWGKAFVRSGLEFHPIHVVSIDTLSRVPVECLETEREEKPARSFTHGGFAHR